MIAVQQESQFKYRFLTKPYKHQIEGLAKAIRHRSYGLFWEPGTGKSKTAIDYAAYLFQTGQIKAVLVIAPLSTAGVWAGADGLGGEIRKHLPTSVKRRIINLAGIGSKGVHLVLTKARPIPGVLDFYVINYDSVWRVLPRIRTHLFNTLGGEIGSVSSPRGYNRTSGNWHIPSLEIVADQTEITEGSCPLLVVADESHLIKHRTSQRSRALHQLAKFSPYRLALTGTPITNTPLNAYSQCLFINPQVFGTNFKSFESYYVMKGGYGQYQVVGYRNIEDFQRRIHRLSAVVHKEDALDLPPKVFQNVPVELETKARDAYDKMAEQMCIDIEEYVEDAKKRGIPFRAMAGIVLTKLLRLSQLTSGFITDTDGAVRKVGSEKLTTAIELIKNLTDENEKVVVFYRFRQELSDLSLKLAEQAIKFRVITGKADDRTRFIREFEESKTPMVLLFQLGTALGQTVVSGNTAIFYSLDYRTDHYIQCQDRLHRRGQTRKVTYLQLLANRTIDHDVLRTLQENKNIAEMCLRAPGGVRGFLQSLTGAPAPADAHST